MKDSLLIVGGSGFIGSHLAIKSLDRGFKTTIVSFKEVTSEKKIKGISYIQSDISNLSELKQKLLKKDFHYVINLSGYIDHSSYLLGGSSVIDVHFDGVQNLLKVLDWSILKKFVQIGSSDEYGSHHAPQNEDMNELPISPYSFAKVASSKLLQMLHRTEDLPVVVFRLFLVYGNGQDRSRFIPQIIKGCLSGKNFPTSKGEQLRDFCHVEDITSGILDSLVINEVNGEIINLASGKPKSIREVIEIIQKLTNSGLPEFGEIAYRTGENMALYANVEKAKKLLNWGPKIKLQEGLNEAIKFYSSES
jgi:nucleoside-diphosphate-sugar epimerase